MIHLQRLSAIGLAAMATMFAVASQAQVGDPGTLIKEKLVSQYKLTKTAADRSDIVTAGDVILLHKDGMMMCSTTGGYAYSNTYANGVMQANLKNRAKNAFKAFGMGALTGGADAAGSANNGCPSRKFVAGEKFWITDIQNKPDGIIVSVFSDPYNDVRYYGEVKFPYVKNQPPPVDAEVKTVADVFSVVPADDDKGGDKADDSKQAPAKEAPAAAAPAMAAIAPPPPPTDAPPAAPKTISKGQTKDEVIAVWGQPTKDIKLGAKEILVFPDMKVTFVAGKVSDVQ